MHLIAFDLFIFDLLDTVEVDLLTDDFRFSLKFVAFRVFVDGVLRFFSIAVELPDDSVNWKEILSAVGKVKSEVTVEYASGMHCISKLPSNGLPNSGEFVGHILGVLSGASVPG